jgi:multidrug efflux pump subunit AcrB
MKVEQIFPTLMIALSFAAAIVYAFDRNWRQTIYWTAAAIITITVTY